MALNGIFDTNFSMLEKNLDLRVKNHQLVASNIANIDTPNYKSFNIRMKDALNSLDNNNTIKLTGSNANHNTDMVEGPYNVRLENYLKESDNIDIDKSMTEMAENSILYSAATQILSKKYNMLKQCINER